MASISFCLLCKVNALQRFLGGPALNKQNPSSSLGFMRTQHEWKHGQLAKKGFYEERKHLRFHSQMCLYKQARV